MGPIPSDLAIALGSFANIFAKTFIPLSLLSPPLFSLTTIINGLEQDIHRLVPRVGKIKCIKCTVSGYTAAYSFDPPANDSANQIRELGADRKPSGLGISNPGF